MHRHLQPKFILTDLQISRIQCLLSVSLQMPHRFHKGHPKLTLSTLLSFPFLLVIWSLVATAIARLETLECYVFPLVHLTPLESITTFCRFPFLTVSQVSLSLLTLHAMSWYNLLWVQTWAITSAWLWSPILLSAKEDLLNSYILAVFLYPILLLSLVLERAHSQQIPFIRIYILSSSLGNSAWDTISISCSAWNLRPTPTTSFAKIPLLPHLF